jgi:hypothetical protein
MIGRRKAASVLLAVALAAAGCEGSGGNDPPPEATGGSPTPGGSPWAARTVEPAPGTPKGWQTFASDAIGIRFAYPAVAGSITESPTGVRHSWIVRRTDRCNARAECRAYEFAAVNAGCPESAPWPTFAHRWAERGSARQIFTCEGRNAFPLPRALRTIDRADGLRGIIYDANVWFGRQSRVPGAIAAVLNFPAGYHDRYRAVAFYFDDPVSLDVVERVLELVALTR